MEDNIFIPDIGYEIAKQAHPYYLNNFCLTTKNNVTCERNKYYILKTWVAPEYSLQELKERFPNLTFNDVVELALVYSPIPESLDYYDRYTLFLHALENNQSDAIDYILEKQSDDETSFIISKELHYPIMILYACYKFERDDILEELLSLPNADYYEQWYEHINAIREAIKVKTGQKHGRLIESPTMIFNRLLRVGELFTAYEIIEAIIIFGGVLNIDDFLGIYMDLFEEAPEQQTTREYYDYIKASTIASLLSRSEIEGLLRKYINSNINFDHKFRRNKDAIVVLKDYNNTIDKYAYYYNGGNVNVIETIPEDMKGIYYITKGDFLSYIAWKERGNEIPDEFILKSEYEEVNEFGLSSIGPGLLGKIVHIKQPHVSITSELSLDQYQKLLKFIHY